MSKQQRRPVAMGSPGEPIARVHRETVAVLGPPLDVWVCSQFLCSPIVHWAGNRHLPCVSGAHPDPCRLCRAGWSRKIQHWLAVALEPHGRFPAQLLCLTDACVVNTPILGEPGISLWGRRIRLWREPADLRGLMYAEVLRDDPPAVLPPDPGVLEELYTMWAARLRQETAARLKGGSAKLGSVEKTE